MKKRDDYGPLKAPSSEPAAIASVPASLPANSNAATEEAYQQSEADEAKFPQSVRSFALSSLLVLACLYTLYFARDILMPITIAVILFLIFWPFTRVLSRMHIPPPLGAGLIVLTLLGSFAIGIYFLWEPATH
jgi:hypothetical protein